MYPLNHYTESNDQELRSNNQVIRVLVIKVFDPSHKHFYRQNIHTVGDYWLSVPGFASQLCRNFFLKLQSYEWNGKPRFKASTD